MKKYNFIEGQLYKLIQKDCDTIWIIRFTKRCPEREDRIFHSGYISSSLSFHPKSGTWSSLDDIEDIVPASEQEEYWFNECMVNNRVVAKPTIPLHSIFN